MNQSHPNLLLILLLPLICLGCGAMAFAFWLTDHRQEVQGPDMWLAISIGLFFVSYTGAFLLFLRWRDIGREMKTGTVSASTVAREDLEGTVYGLIPESQYQVVKSFTDYYGNSFERGEILRFRERHFLPYDGGHMILFHERPLYLQEERDQQILDHFSDYLIKIVR